MILTVVCTCIYVLSQRMLLLLGAIIINWYLSIVDMTCENIILSTEWLQFGTVYLTKWWWLIILYIQCYSEDLSLVITHSHWTLLMVSTGQLSRGLQKPLRDFFDHEVCRGCALGPNWGLSAGVPCAPAPKVR